MESENEVRTRRPRRSKADIEEAINKAAIGQIKKKGFSLALVTDIVKRAKIEPIVFYNRYKNLDEFYDEFVKNYDYWLVDTIHDTPDQLSTEEGYSNILERIFNSLFKDEIMAELIRWEIAEGNHITERTARLRELHAIELNNNYLTQFRELNPDIDIPALSALIVGGIYYLILHRDRSAITGIDINTPEGKNRIVKAIRSFSALLFHDKANKLLAEGATENSAEEYRRRFEKTCRNRLENDYRVHIEEVMQARQKADRDNIARLLRNEGISEEIINRCIK